jgi:hypothetical protein
MTHPERWLESREASKDVLELLEHARAPRPIDTAALERSRRRLAALSAVPAAAGVFFWLQNAALGAVLGAAVGGGAVLARGLFEATSAAPERATPARPSSSPTVARTAPAPAPDPSTREEAPQAPPALANHRGALAANSTPSAPSEAVVSSDVAREAYLLERARALLATNPSSALRTLQQHEREFGAGTLQLEREFLRIDALVRLGRSAEARERAGALRRLSPGHLYEQRLKSLLGSSE